jgi:hypothetical protein
MSKIMPRTNHYVSVNSAGKMVHHHKWLIFCNLKEAHLSFKEQNPEKLLCFSKSAELEPKTECWLAVMHAVCVCTIHQNVKLIIFRCKTAKQIKTYNNCLFKKKL